MVLTFPNARAEVLRRIAVAQPAIEHVALEASAGRVLAETIYADRDYPPFPRATRDGYAVRAADVAAVPATLEIIGEVKAGSEFMGSVGAGQCVSIMTGAPVPSAADAVVMVEYTESLQSPVTIHRSVAAGENVVPRGSESAAGSVVVHAGWRIGFPEIAMLASVGRAAAPVFRRPRVAIIPTGDEIVELDRAPSSCQIRNSNSYSLRAQVARAGGEPWALPIAPDEITRLREIVEQGLTADLLLLSGGVSMGKFDLVEQVLSSLGAEIFFDGVEIQPGRPLVFGRCRESKALALDATRDTWFFGLPGNPLSTMVCFELFARPAIAQLSGAAAPPLLFPRARLSKPVRVKPGLTRFLPAVLSGEGDNPTVELSGWQGSGDVSALVRSNCFVVVPPDCPEMNVGEWIGVLPLDR
jgi:molybdopterin molybdotransferase